MNTTTTIQNTPIKRLPYTRMLKSEMADYAEKIITIVENHHSDSAIITPLFNVLAAKQPEIAMLRLSYGVDTERLRADKLKGIMKLTVSSFKLNVKMLSKSNQALDMYVVQNAINSHLRYFNKCKNDKQLNQKIAGFLDLMHSDKVFTAAIDEFNLATEVQKIARAYTMFNEALSNRVNLLAKRPQFSTQSIIKELFGVIDNLFKGIEVAQVISSLPVADTADAIDDLTPLMDELKQLSDMYYKSYTMRKTTNKQKHEKKQLVDANSENSLDVESTTELQTKAKSSSEAYHPSEVYKASIGLMDTIPTGEMSTVRLNGNSVDATYIDDEIEDVSNRKLLVEIDRPCSS